MVQQMEMQHFGQLSTKLTQQQQQQQQQLNGFYLKPLQRFIGIFHAVS